MNHIHTCPICGAVEICDWDDEDCAMWNQPVIECASCQKANMLFAITHRLA